MRRWRLSPLGIPVVVAFVAGVILLFVGSSHAVQLIGLAMALLALVAAVGPVLGMWGSGVRGVPPGQAREPDYIPEAAPTSEDAWARELQRYRTRDVVGPPPTESRAQ